MAVPRAQLRLSAEELDTFLGAARTLRLATVGDDGVPHVVPLWFVWRDGAVWLNSLKRSRRHRHLVSGRPVGLVVDDGERYDELRGVRMTGQPAVATTDEAAPAVRLFAAKYFGITDGQPPSQHSYEVVVIRPDEVASWDFRKIPQGADRKVGLDRSR